MKKIKLLLLFCCCAVGFSQAQTTTENSGTVTSNTSESVSESTDVLSLRANHEFSFSNSGTTTPSQWNEDAGTATRLSIPTNSQNRTPVVITHSLSQTIEAPLSAACGTGGINTENHYYRDFDLANDFGIAGDFNVTAAEFGVEVAGGPVVVTVNIWSSTGAAFPDGTLVLEGTASYNSTTADTGTVVSVPVTATIPAGAVMVFEFIQADGSNWYIGSNSLGQTGVSWLSANDCGVPEPTDAGLVGFPNMHLLMNVVGEEVDAVAPETLFITKWVVGDGETITIPTTGSGYDYDVDWSYAAGDGFNAESANQTGNATSPSLSAGEHIVAITGDFPRIYFNNSGDKNKITEIVQWGTNPWTSMNRAFEGCSNLNIVNPSVGEPDLSSVTNMRRMFYRASSFNSAIGDWNVSNITNMSLLFARCNSFNQDLNNWDVSSVTDMSYMFLEAPVFNGNLDWDVSNVEKMNQMFRGALAFNQDISNWDTNSAFNMRKMFQRSLSFDQNLGAWDIGSVTTMEDMFLSTALSTANYDNTLIGWATDSSVTPGDGIDDVPSNIIFSGGTSTYCNGETARDLLTAAGPAPIGYGWTITDGGLALDCVPTASLFITKWMVLAGETITIPTTGSGYNYSVDWSYDVLDGFNAESMNQTGNATSPALSAGEHIVAISGDFPRIFFNDSGDKDKITEIVQWGTNPWTSMLNAFNGCSNLNITNPAAGEPDLTLVTNMRRMFNKADSFNGDVGDWDVSNVTDMSYLFKRCRSFNQDVSNWNTSNATTMREMFNQAWVFNGSLDWDVSNVEDMSGMFFHALAFNQDVSSWDTSNVTDMFRMFNDAESFDQSLGAWDIGSVTNMEQFLFDAGLSTANYDSTLIGWATDSSVPGDGIDDIPTNITFDGGSSTYCAGEVARTSLISTYSWNFTDGGLDCPIPLLGSNNANLDLVSLYPNPTQGAITIVSPTEIVTSATVYDIGGRIVSKVDFRNETIYRIDLSDMDAAVYLIEIATENGTVMKRVMKK